MNGQLQSEMEMHMEMHMQIQMQRTEQRLENISYENGWGSMKTVQVGVEYTHVDYTSDPQYYSITFQFIHA